MNRPSHQLKSFVLIGIWVFLACLSFQIIAKESLASEKASSAIEKRENQKSAPTEVVFELSEFSLPALLVIDNLDFQPVLTKVFSEKKFIKVKIESTSHTLQQKFFLTLFRVIISPKAP